MTDRIPTKPGRVQLVPVTGQTNLYDMSMADEPTEAGTPLNKANLLSDAAASAVWPVAADRPADPTVSDAFTRLGTKGKILLADITTTTAASQSAPVSIPLACNFEDLRQLEVYCINSSFDSATNGALFIGEFDTAHRVCEVNWLASSAQYDVIKLITIIQNDSGGHYFASISFSGTGVTSPKSTGAGALTGNTLLLARGQSSGSVTAGVRLVIFGTRL